MAAWPTLQELRKLLRLQPDANEDAVLQSALYAAIDYVRRRLALGPVPPDDSGDIIPDAAHHACLLHSARLYRRRDSLDGTIGIGEGGVIRAGGYDGDVERLYASLGPVVFG